MKQYVTFVKDAEESRQVQEALCRAGFLWGGTGEPRVDYLGYNFIRINYYGRGSLECGGDFDHNAKFIASDGYIPFSANRIIDNPFQLDGAQQAEKMITVGGNEYPESLLIELVEAAENLEAKS